MKTPIWAILLVILGTLIGSFGAILLKKGSKAFSLNIKRLLKNKHLIIGVLLYVISTVPFVIALKSGELSVLYPVVSLSYLWVTLLSIRLLKEKMNFYKWIGIFLIILGVVFIGLGR